MKLVIKEAVIFILFVLYGSFCFPQKGSKEIIYVLFDKQSKEKCKVSVEGKGYVMMNKYRKEYENYGNIINFKICNESFTAQKTKSVIDTCHISSLNDTKFVDFKYLIKRYNSSDTLKHQLFEKIYFFEKISEAKVIKYEVIWVDDMLMIDD